MIRLKISIMNTFKINAKFTEYWNQCAYESLDWLENCDSIVKD